jgi:hypothetical protein
MKSKKGHGSADGNKSGSLIFNTTVFGGKSNEVQVNLEPGLYFALAGLGQWPPKFDTMFTVPPAKAPATLPTPQAKIRAIDFAFIGPTTLHDGELVGFENQGFLVHMNIGLLVKGREATSRSKRIC